MRLKIVFGVGALVLSLVGCEGGTKVDRPGSELKSISVTPATPSVAKGFTQQFQALGTYSDGTTAELGSQAGWASSNAEVASITSSGLATGSSVGGTGITATVGSVSGSATLSVTSAVLQSIAVAPATASVAVGLTRQLTATGSYSDGTSADLTSQVTWATSGSGLVTVTPTGLATGAAPGDATVSATWGAITGNARLTVTAASLQAIIVAPVVRSIPAGLTLQFSAVGVYSDASMPDLTALVTWSSSNAAAATVTAGGLATGVGVGSTTLTATLGAVSGATMLSITPARVQSIVVTPAPASVTSGSTRQLTAIAAYSDGATADLTSRVTWSSSDPSVATVGSGGLATGGATVGSATITASSDGISASTTLEVAPDPSSMISFGISGPNPVAPGSSTTFTGTVCAGCAFSIEPAASISSSSVSSGRLSATSSALQTSTTFTLTVTNSAGASARQAVTVDVNRPVATSFQGPSSWTTGKNGILLVATFGGGPGATASVLATSGSTGSTCTPGSSTTSPQAFVCSSITTDTTYTLTVSLGSGSNSTTTETLRVRVAPTQSTTNGLMPASFGAAIAALPGGKVLIAGGSSLANGSAATRTAFVFDPSTGMFLPAGNGPGCTGSRTTMSSRRFQGTATLLASGKVLLAGGSTDGTALNAQPSADLYDGSADCFTLLGAATMSFPRFRHTATALPNGKVLLAGGTGTSGAPLSSGELFDPNAGGNQFSLIAGSMTARTDATANLLPNGLVLIAGGTATAVKADLFDSNSPTAFSLTNGAMQIARSQHTATLLGNGLVLFVGGSGATPPGSASNSAELYNPTTGVFTPVGGVLGSARFAHTATLLPDGTVLIAGGTMAAGFATASTELFDPATASFSAAAALSVPRSQAVATFLSSGSALVTGGNPGFLPGDLFAR